MVATPPSFLAHSWLLAYLRSGATVVACVRGDGVEERRATPPSARLEDRARLARKPNKSRIACRTRRERAAEGKAELRRGRGLHARPLDACRAGEAAEGHGCEAVCLLSVCV